MRRAIWAAILAMAMALPPRGGETDRSGDRTRPAYVISAQLPRPHPQRRDGQPGPVQDGVVSDRRATVADARR